MSDYTFLISQIERICDVECSNIRSSFPNFNIPSHKYVQTLSKMKVDLKFDFFKSHTCVDWPADNQFELMTLLFSTHHLKHIWISVFISRDNPLLDTASSLYPIAEFQEREVYDLFGILYRNHSDLRRIFLDDDWQGFPLRKDYHDDFMLARPK